MERKRLLVLTPRFPYPAIGGDRVRILHICRALSSEFDLTLLSFCETYGEMCYVPQDGIFSTVERIYLPPWRSYLNTVLAVPSSRPLQLAYYESSKFRERLKALLPQHDLVVAHLIRTGQYIEDISGPRILEMTDAISMNYGRMRLMKRNYNWRKLVYLLEKKRLQKYELRTVQKFERVWVTSQLDRDYLDPSHLLPIDLIRQGADLENLPFRLPASNANVIVFIGNMNSLQNQDACHYFIQRILPGVRAHANVIFRIVGNASESVQRQFRAYAGVQMTGRVERIQDGVESAFCGVCPVRAAAGTQTKILEYLALGLPCVTSMIGLGGVEAKTGEDLLAYSDPGEAVTQILNLYSDLAVRLRMAISGRKFVCENYDWRSVYRSVIDSCRKVSDAAETVPS
jgi:glycosyltransferase involved in cell wall biosynthesis